MSDLYTLGGDTERKRFAPVGLETLEGLAISSALQATDLALVNLRRPTEETMAVAQNPHPNHGIASERAALVGMSAVGPASPAEVQVVTAEPVAAPALKVVEEELVTVVAAPVQDLQEAMRQDALAKIDQAHADRAAGLA